MTQEEDLKGWELLALYGERPRGGGGDTVPGSSVGRGTCLLCSVPQGKDMGVDVSRRQISGRERASCLALGLFEVRRTWVRHANLGRATQSMVRGPGARVLSQTCEPQYEF